jgi:hypothetical protein
MSALLLCLCAFSMTSIVLYTTNSNKQASLLHYH